jgi:hypothetical protein
LNIKQALETSKYMDGFANLLHCKWRFFFLFYNS